MREDLQCLVKGRVVKPDGSPSANRPVEFLPTQPYFVVDNMTYATLGASEMTDDEGWFTVTLTRSDVTGGGVRYLTHGAIGNYLITLNGPGPHLMSKLRKAGQKMPAMDHDS